MGQMLRWLDKTYLNIWVIVIDDLVSIAIVKLHIFEEGSFLELNDLYFLAEQEAFESGLDFDEQRYFLWAVLALRVILSDAPIAWLTIMSIFELVLLLLQKVITRLAAVAHFYNFN